ncbi:unnamed protein product, partial [Mesorhabditis spiculigera]
MAEAEGEDAASTSSQEDRQLLAEVRAEAEGRPEVVKHKNLDDFLTLGRYTLFFLFNTEMMTLTSLICANPIIRSCGEVVFENQKDACRQLPNLTTTTGCVPQLEYQFYSVNVEFNYLCQEEKLVKNSISVQMLGVLFGAVIFGQVSDSYGRKFTILISLFGIAVTSLMNAYVPSFFYFYWIRILVGFFTGGLSTSMGVYQVENIPMKHRMWISTVITWSPNFIIFPIIAYYCHDWRTLLKANAICAILSAVCISFIYESPRFLIQKGRVEEARRIFAKIRKIDRNSDYNPQELEAMLVHEQENHEKRVKKQRQYTYYHIICTWEMISWTCTLAIGIAITSLTNYGLMFNMEKLSGSLYWNNVFMGIIRWTMNIAVGLSDYKLPWFGRKVINMMALVFNGFCLACVCVLYYTGTQNDGGWVLRYCTIGATAMCSQLYLSKFMACNELYPTSVRNLAVAVLAMFSRIGTIVAPQLFYLSDISAVLPYLALLAFTLFDAFLFQVFIPETKGTPLPDNLPPKEQRLFYREKKRRVSLITEAI